MGKKEDKQFPLTNKKNCAVYLNRIISSCERCMDMWINHWTLTRVFQLRSLRKCKESRAISD